MKENNSMKEILLEEEQENYNTIFNNKGNQININNKQKIIINKPKVLIEEETIETTESHENSTKNKKKKLLSNNINRYITLYNLKDFLLMLGLLLSPSFSFSYLYYPFIISGILYAIIIYKNTSKYKKFKSVFTFIVFIYSLLILFFIIIVIIVHSVLKKDIIKENKFLFIDLGVSYLLKENFFNIMKSLFGPVLMILIYIISSIFEKKCNFQDKDLERKKKKDFKYLDNFYVKVKRYLIVSFLIIAAFATFNKSLLTMFYLFLFYLLLAIYLIFSEKFVYAMYKIYLIIEIILIAFHLVAINITNTYSISNKIINSSTYNSLSKNWGQMGLYLVNYEKDDTYNYFFDWTGYFFGCLSFVSFIFI